MSLNARTLALIVGVLAIAAAATALLLNDDDSSGPGDSPQPKPAALTVSVQSDEAAEPVTYELTCGPAGGTHPTPEAACDIVAQLGAEIFEPIPAGQACTQIFGGPQQARVTGTYDGTKVDSTFSRSDGCQIARWDALGPVFFVIDTTAT